MKIYKATIDLWRNALINLPKGFRKRFIKKDLQHLELILLSDLENMIEGMQETMAGDQYQTLENLKDKLYELSSSYKK